MISQTRKRSTIATSNHNYINSPKKSDAKSLKSKNQKSQSQKKNSIGRRNPSVYDSDTESSRMRKASHYRASPYRQGSRPVNGSTSAKKKVDHGRGTPRYNNISNLYKKNENGKLNRSRSRSQSVRRKESPPISHLES